MHAGDMGWQYRNLFFSIVVILLSIVLVWSFRNQRDDFRKKLGTKAVMLLYDFGTVEELDTQMYQLKKIATDSVFNQLTIDNEERTLNTYLKFKGGPVTVNVVQATDSYVLYTLKCDAVDLDRHFIFMFDMSVNGKLNYVREAETFDFIDYVD